MQIEEFFPYKLAVTADVFSRQLASVYGGRHGLSREEWRFRFLLEGSGGVSSLSLSQRTSLDKVQVSRAAARWAWACWPWPPPRCSCLPGSAGAGRCRRRAWATGPWSRPSAC